ncbi:MAG: hypothetical protein WBG30_14445 [Psychrilyobacter sp.]|uniref:hypothetical protein n=1 Tax=Psychrilyobacter sp. TaxID=2586924 RepID=UPI003C756BE8
MTYLIDDTTHIIHTSICPHILLTNMIMLGIYMDYEEALANAKDQGYLEAICCSYCCSSAHIE